MTHDPATSVGTEAAQTEVGSVFVSNYPPYSFWGPQYLDALQRTLETPPRPDAPLGLYLHIPFCRKRCKFCYFKVFVEKNAAEVQRYLDAVYREIDLWTRTPAVGPRKPRFVYFGGGTPSFISATHLRQLLTRLRAGFAWDAVEEVTFECEPGTLTRPKLETIRELGITRLSLGVESFDDRILGENGRAHTSVEIRRVAPWIESLDFDQVNIDLIAGMVGETAETWRTSVARAIEMAPDSVTIYPMELPFNTVYSRQILDGGGVAFADWATKREWQTWAFEELAGAGYAQSSAYTMVRRGSGATFVYRDAVWHGSDLLSLGVSSFGHLGGAHYQNASAWEAYLEPLEAGRLALERAFVPAAEELLTRELILQLKLGRIDAGYFRDKFGVDVTTHFAPALSRLAERGMLELVPEGARLTRDGLLRVDALLPEFYAPRYQNARYT